ncbi:DEAD/DEAH box helicase [Chitinophaga hostae]|uniref:DNA 3'-5' helicase II n=1 Tax=Chitinophaga hostae TaxID=2831022 RepID=A0ABS5IXZ3_9BACT|nr:ATP-binding domain-containing protein [Chitinophaga hostae]MBS0027087.1 DEAD/DEAH box helicase [Chitinophaga hostae]
MEKNLLYIQIEENSLNSAILNEIKGYCGENPNEQLYVINAPLGDKKYKYPYQENAVVILSPRHKLMFVDLKGDDESFEEFYDDFLEDINSISDKYNYRNHIGRPREWKQNNTALISYGNLTSFKLLLNNNKIAPEIQRVSELLISLLIGSINDIDKVGAKVPETILARVKKNIILFDGEQTRFIYQEFNKKSVSIQGLSGTGKTELLLHKLKELYIQDESSRIYFTCHNIALANNLRERVPNFFNFMRVDKQIEWHKRLWVTHAWGSKNDPNTGFYSYLCNFYNLPFSRWSVDNTYEKIFKQILDRINLLNENDFEFAFDYILVDERQDFPSVFFELCEKIAKHKVYIAGDIFQDIFEKADKSDVAVDIVLNRCYRTDPRTLMFAHGIGLGLFEKKKLNWFPDSYWNDIGYTLERVDGNLVRLHRDPIRRFEDLNTDDFESVVIGGSNSVGDVVKIITGIRTKHKDLLPDDIAIIILEENTKQTYEYIDSLSVYIGRQLGWNVNRAYENKNKIPNTVFVSNSNNVKGLEFPFVICIAGSITNTYKFRNILYTMLTRSFIQSYLLVHEEKGIDQNKEGLRIINKYHYIQTIEPNVKEKREIQNKLTKFIQSNTNLSYEDFLTNIFDELNIDKDKRSKLSEALLKTGIDRFDKAKTIKFIRTNLEFYM